MFGSFGATEMLIVGAIAMLIFGPSQLPKLGRSIGQTIKEFRGAGRELTQSLEEGLNDDKKR